MPISQSGHERFQTPSPGLHLMCDVVLARGASTCSSRETLGPERQTLGERTSNKSWFRADLLGNSPSFTSNRRRSCLPIRYSISSSRSCVSHGGSQLG